MYNMKKIRVQKGFTLVELMMVVGIIGMLAAISLPTFSEYSKNAKVAETYIIIKAYADAEKAYFIENQEFVDFVHELDGFPRFTVPDRLPHEGQALLGFPVAPGTLLHFGYKSFAGDEGLGIDGLPLEFGIGINKSPSDLSEVKQCVLGSLNAGDLGADSSVAATDTYNFVFVVGKTNLNLDESDQCDAVFQLIETYDNSVNFISSPMIRYQFEGEHGSGGSESSGSTSSSSEDTGDASASSSDSSGDSGSRGSDSGEAAETGDSGDSGSRGSGSGR